MHIQFRMFLDIPPILIVDSTHTYILLVPLQHATTVIPIVIIAMGLQILNASNAVLALSMMEPLVFLVIILVRFAMEQQATSVLIASQTYT